MIRHGGNSVFAAQAADGSDLDALIQAARPWGRVAPKRLRASARPFWVGITDVIPPRFRRLETGRASESQSRHARGESG